jgi:alkanesulfonate monooxygenase SsuD/methylene tetrahydromethanopterin reductase-like flavin-dependent oxidoreductase (luciferase family)
VYENIGIHAYHMAEHHATPLGMSPSPSVFISALAQRTKTLRFGPLVYTLALYHPLRLADEICMLDHMSGGRLQLGIGRGVSPIEIQLFGFDPQKAQAMYLEGYQVIKQSLTQDTVNFEGEYYTFKDVPALLKPLQKPMPPIWYGTSNPPSATWAAGEGFNVVTNGLPTMVSEVTGRYRAEWTRLGRDPAQIPFMGTTRHIVIADTDKEAMEIGRRAYSRWYDNFMYLWRMRNTKPLYTTYTESFDEVVANGQGIAGSPATVRSAMLKQAAETGINYFLLRLAFGDMTLAESTRSANLFNEHIKGALIEQYRKAA